MSTLCSPYCSTSHGVILHLCLASSWVPLQHLRLCSSGYFSPTCRLNAGSSLGQGWCIPSFVHINTWGPLSLVSVFTAVLPLVNAHQCLTTSLAFALAFTATFPLVCSHQCKGAASITSMSAFIAAPTLVCACQCLRTWLLPHSCQHLQPPPLCPCLCKPTCGGVNL